MATKTFEELKQLAIQIRDEKTNKQNTATRVGTAMLEHINKLEQDYYDKTQTDEELKERDDKLIELDRKIYIYRDNCPNVGKYYPTNSINIGDTFNPDSMGNSGDYGCFCIRLQKDKKIIINYNGITPGVAANKLIVCNLNFKITNILELNNNITEYTSSEDCYVAATMYRPQLGEIFSYAYIDGISVMGNYVGVDELVRTSESHGKDITSHYIIYRDNCLYVGRYYNTQPLIVGGIFNPDKTSVSGDYGCFYLLLHINKKIVINYNGIGPGVVANKLIVCDLNFKITNLIDLNNSITEYTATEDCYVAATMSRPNLGEKFSYASIDDVSVIGNYAAINKLNKDVTSHYIIYRDNCTYVGRYYGTSGLKTGDTFNPDNTGVSGDYGCFCLLLQEDKKIIINYNGITPGVAANKLIVCDLNFNITNLVELTSGITEYTATSDCYVAATMYRPQLGEKFSYASIDGISVMGNRALLEDLQRKITGVLPEISDAKEIVMPQYINVDPTKNNIIFLEDISVTEQGDDIIYALPNNSPYGLTSKKETHGRYILPTEDCAITFSRRNKSLKEYTNKIVNVRAISQALNTEREIGVCIGGDSLIDGTNAPCEAFKLLKEKGYNITQIGTRNAVMDDITYKHEGRGSWAYRNYCINENYASKTNAFLYDGELNFQRYMQDNFPGKNLDVFLMSLGTNDVKSDGINYILSDSQINEEIEYARKFVDALLSEDRGYPNCKIILGLPGKGAPTIFQSFGINIQHFNKKLIEVFDNGKYNPNVTTVMHGCYICRWESYKYEDEQINQYLTATARKFTDGIHPQISGYKSWGYAYYNAISYAINSL